MTVSAAKFVAGRRALRVRGDKNMDANKASSQSPAVGRPELIDQGRQHIVHPRTDTAQGEILKGFVTVTATRGLGRVLKHS